MKKYLLFLLISIFSFISCDILRLSKFEIVSWTPGGGFYDNPDNIFVSVEFSHEPDKASVERNFSLTGNGNRIRGNFFWDGNIIIFSPLTPLEKNTDYIINISENTRDTEGLSMDYAFIGNFTTRASSVRPVLISYNPSMYAQIDDMNAKIMLEFSLPVPLKALYDNVSFNPSMSGLWHIENSGRLAVFTPSQSWVNNSRYEIKINNSLTDNNGMNIGSEFSGIFFTGTDSQIPRLLSAWRITNNNEMIELISCGGYSGMLNPLIENTDWEKNDRFLLIFSKPVHVNSVKNFIVVDDGPNLIAETQPGYENEIYFRFENIPAYKSRFTIRIKPGIKDSSEKETKEENIFRIFADGKLSMPPELAGIRMPMSPKNETDKKLKFYDAGSLYKIIPISDEFYPSGESVDTWIELYFKTAEGALIEPFSVMELFRIETSNNVINFSPRHVKTDNFTVPEPETGWETYQRIEILGSLINTTFFGIINFQISPGLEDTLGNRNEKLLGIPLLK